MTTPAPAYTLLGTEVEQEAYLVRRGWQKHGERRHTNGEARWAKPLPPGSKVWAKLGHTSSALALQVSEDLAQIAELQDGLNGLIQLVK